MTRTLVAGIGNIFFGDDGFGVEVATRLAAEPTAPGVRVEDFGIRAVHLAYELLDGYDVLVMVDALALGDAPGTVTVVEPHRPASPDAVPVDSHTMSPDLVLDVLATLGGRVAHVYVVGCEPESIAPGIGLSPRVAAAVDPAVRTVRELLAELTAEPAAG